MYARSRASKSPSKLPSRYIMGILQIETVQGATFGTMYFPYGVVSKLIDTAYRNLRYVGACVHKRSKPCHAAQQVFKPAADKLSAQDKVLQCPTMRCDAMRRDATRHNKGTQRTRGYRRSRRAMSLCGKRERSEVFTFCRGKYTKAYESRWKAVFILGTRYSDKC